MGTLLSKRNKVVAGIVFFCTLLIIPFYYFIKINGLSENKVLTADIQASIKKAERVLGKRIKDLNIRSEYLYKRSRVSILRHDDMLPEESVITVKDGVIESYFGEVFFFKFEEMDARKWKFIVKENTLYFLKKYDDNLFYLRKFDSVDNLFSSIKKKFPFISIDTNYFNFPNKNDSSSVEYDKNMESFFLYHISENANRQLFVVIKFSSEEYLTHEKKSFSKKFIIFYIMLLILFIVLFYRIFKRITWVVFILFILSVMLLLNIISDGSMNMNILGTELGSVLQMFFISFLIFLFSVWFSNVIKGKSGAIIISFLMMTGSVLVVIEIIHSVNFLYSDFRVDPNYIFFLFAVFLLLNAPFRFQEVSVSDPNRKGLIFFISLGVVFTVIIRSLTPLPITVPLLLSVSLILIYLFKRGFFSDIFKIFLLSVVIFIMIFSYSEKEKQSFVSVGLKNIFSNQNNYAKFISRELIHSIHQKSTDLSEYFGKDKGNELEKIWRRSIALKENISSGIYVVSGDDRILSSFSYRIPYLNISSENMFPFWMINEFKAEYFGKTISVAVASINVYDSEKYLGKIIIQVINSSDLLTKDHPDNNIFTLDRRINGEDLSYIKLNSKMQVVENPSNIDIRNIYKRTAGDGNWMKFKFMDTKFIGYVFESNDDTLIIFYPQPTPGEEFSNIIKIFLLLLFINAFINLKKFFNLKWRNLLNTFSLRVFIILILISLFSAIIFSVFSIQFNRRSREIDFRRQIFNNGGVAYNIISDIIEKDKVLERDHLFFLSKILNADITIYLNDRLLDTSNYNKIINSEIPVLISSKLPVLLEESEKFVIESSKNISSIYFSISDYIVRMDYTDKSRDILTRPGMYSNFIINLFFFLTIAGILLAFFFRRKIISPINILNSKMLKVKRGELEKIEEIPGEIEIKNLFKGFNSMISGIEEQKKNVSDIARMKTLIKLSRWIAHEVKNPLTPIKLSAEQILLSMKDKREGYEKLITESVNYIMDETDQLRNISLGFLEISNLDKIEPEEFNLVELCEKEVSKLQNVYKAIKFEFKYKDKFPLVKYDRIKITQVLKNLLMNSIESIKIKGGIVSINLEYSGDMVEIIIEDNGSGIDESDSEKIFSEEFTTKSSGTGLGLFIVKRIIDLHKGTINISGDKSGTVVRIILPCKYGNGIKNINGEND